MKTGTGSTLRVVCLLILAFTMTSCAGAIGGTSLAHVPKMKLTGWQELRSDDFVLYSTGSRKDLQTLGTDLSRYVAVVERLVNSQSPKQPAKIFLLVGRAERLFIPNPNVAGYMAHSLSGFGGFMRGSTHDPMQRHVLLHEFSHYLNLRNRKVSYPTWYVEGFAEFLGPTRTRGDMMEIGSAPPRTLTLLGYQQREEKGINLEAIFSYDRRSGQRYPPFFYQISWATVHYLNTTPDGQKRLVEMLKYQDAGLAWQHAFRRSFDESIEDLEAKIRGHIGMLRKGTPSAVLFLPLESLAVRDDFEIRSVPPIEVLQLLGGFAVREEVSGDTKESMQLGEALFRRALGFEASDALSHAGLAVALAGQGQFAEAAIHLEAFDNAVDPSAEAIVHAGNALQQHAFSLEAKEDQKRREVLHASAINLFLRALRSEASNASALAGLGRSQLESGEFESAKRSFQRARVAGEWDASLTLNQGRVEAKLGSKERATDFWNEVVRLGTEHDAKKARALLENLDAKQ